MVILRRILQTKILHIRIDPDKTLLDYVQLLSLFGLDGPTDETIQANGQP